MYKIAKKGNTFHLTFNGFIQASEMQEWVEASKKELATVNGGFGVFVDMRDLKPLANDVKAVLEEGQKLYKMKGMVRSVVVVNSAMAAMQLKRIARETGIYEWERYVSSDNVADWEKVALDWVEKGIDPD